MLRFLHLLTMLFVSVLSTVAHAEDEASRVGKMTLIAHHCANSTLISLSEHFK